MAQEEKMFRKSLFLFKELSWYKKLYYSLYKNLHPENIINKIKHLFYWIVKTAQYSKVLWNDYDWDYSYMLKLLRYKLVRMEKNIRFYSYAESNLRTAKQIKYAIFLIDRYNGNYTANDFRLLTQKESIFFMKKKDEIRQDAKKRLFRHIDRYMERWWG
jgi:hypothetical protein